jgi:NADH-quinone oxidoreductase subunit H
MSGATIAAAVILGFLVTPVVGLALKWVDRLVTARIQWRTGPPPYQPFADVLKLLGKETVVSEDCSAGVFLAAPIVGVVGLGVAASILWAAALSPQSGFVGDMIAVVYFLVFPALAIILGGSASGAPHGALGASREMKLVVAYELPLILALAAVILNAAAVLRSPPTFRFADILAAQQQSGPLLGSVSGAIAFVCVLAVMQAKLGLVPFDQAEAETELMGGAILDYSGPPLALIHLGRSMLLLVLPMLVITVFWGGIRLTGWGLLSALGKVVVLLVVIVLVRNTHARLRIDQAVRFFWFFVTPLAIVACALSASNYYGQVALGQ